MSVRTEVTEPALTDLLKEFKEIRDVTVPKEELDGAKRDPRGELRAGPGKSRAGAAALDAAARVRPAGGLLGHVYRPRSMAVTAADVARVAKKYVPYDNVQIIAVGDGAKIRES